jgi:hypothetical protein
LRPATSVDTGIEKKLKQFQFHMVRSGSAILEHLPLYDKVKGFSLAVAAGAKRYKKGKTKGLSLTTTIGTGIEKIV